MQVRSANSSRQRFLSYWVYLRSDSPADHSRNLVNLSILVVEISERPKLGQQLVEKVENCDKAR